MVVSRKPKGMKQILFERGLFVKGMTEWGQNAEGDSPSSMRFVLSQCLDFKLQKTALEEHIERVAIFVTSYPSIILRSQLLRDVGHLPKSICVLGANSPIKIW